LFRGKTNSAYLSLVMRVAIINITGGGMSGGYRQYLRNVITRMAVCPSVEAILCASSKSLNVKDCLEQLSNVKFVNCKPFRFLHRNLDPELKQHLEKFSPNVIFIPLERYFRFNEVPIVNMLQNMEPFVLGIEGNPFGERLRNWFRKIYGKRALKKSNQVIAVSRYVRDFLIQHLNIPSDKIGLVYHGVDLPENKDTHRPDIIPKGWDGQFLFTAGSIRPARGLEDAIYALKHLSDKSPNIPPLVIAGETTSKMTKYRKTLENWIRDHKLSSKVCWTGTLNEKETAWCYQNCNAFVMTSRVESFGIIGAEAMSYGCICISADNPCLQELFGDAAIYYSPKDGKALADVIKTVFAWDDNQRKAMSEKAKRRASDFSWDVCAEKTVAELAKAAKSWQFGKL